MGKSGITQKQKIFIENGRKPSCFFKGKEIKYTYPPYDEWLVYENKSKK